jgi:hypothetical protein
MLGCIETVKLHLPMWLAHNQKCKHTPLFLCAYVKHFLLNISQTLWQPASGMAPPVTLNAALFPKPPNIVSALAICPSIALVLLASSPPNQPAQRTCTLSSPTHPSSFS